MREDLGGEYAGAIHEFSRVRADIRAAYDHFPNTESYTTTDGGIYIKAALQTSVGQVYIVMVTFSGYPSAMPRVTVITPAVKHIMHMYREGHICYMLPSFWNSCSTRSPLCSCPGGGVAE